MIQHRSLPVLVGWATCLVMGLVPICRGVVPEATPGSLYVRMGGEPTVKAVVDDLIDESASDPHLKRSFAKVDLARLKRLLAEQICALSGGGCQYTGDSMHEVHAGLGITQAEFYRLVDVLRDSLRRHGVALRERDELLKILAPMKRDVVEK